ncbi:hypothetical protein EON65_09560 [archaeon]|nr:MAG: hypothetical protein EON65_09560 [archaeon]
MYKYDAIGSYEQVAAACAGKGEQMIQPLLDELSNLDEDDGLWTVSDQQGSFVSSRRCVHLTEEQAVNILCKGFRAAAEREISIGDGFDMCIIARDKESRGEVRIRRMHFPLPKH